MSIEQRFWRRVNKNGPVPTDRPELGPCWIWINPGRPGRYGQISRDGKWVLAHRWSWEHINGPLPEGMLVLHKCDNPPCVNPAHLFAGTRKDNTQDCLRKGRWKKVDRRGERNGRAKWTDSQIAEIRERVASGDKQSVIVRELGMSSSHLSAVVKGLTRNHERDSG